MTKNCKLYCTRTKKFITPVPITYEQAEKVKKGVDSYLVIMGFLNKEKEYVFEKPK